MNKKDLWVGLNERARKGLTPRNYKSGSLGQRIAESGVDAGELTASRSKTELKKVWIPGVEIFSRETHPQRHRGSFGHGNGQPRGCSPTAPKDFISIRRAFRRMRRRNNGCDVCLSLNRKTIRCDRTIASNGTSCFFYRAARKFSCVMCAQVFPRAACVFLRTATIIGAGTTSAW